MKNNLPENISRLFSFIKQSPSCFHAVNNLQNLLQDAGFVCLAENQKWELVPGKKYFTSRNGSSIIAFALPEGGLFKGFRIAASHSDSPSFKIKENPEIRDGGCVTLNVEKYGGMLLNPWFDRPLSIAGRAVINGKNGLEQKLVNFDRNLVMIPNLAIHMNREANEGRRIDVQKEIQPVISLNENFRLSSMIARELSVEEKDIVSSDLFLYDRSEPAVWGAENEFISSPKLDDLECALLTFSGFISAVEEKPENDFG